MQYARQGWPVFPCREKDHHWTDHKGKARVSRAKSPYVGNGLNDATTDEQVILGWWKRWPEAMIGFAVGKDRIFVLDFDPRHDPETGEDFTLEALKAALEEKIGVPVPASLAVRTPSGGVHVYLREPNDGGEELRNKVGTNRKTSVLPQHVDVRARGGYVVLPPSRCHGGEKAAEGEYRWLRGRRDAPVEDAPAELIALLRQKPRAEARGAQSAGADQAPSSSSSSPDVSDPPILPSGAPAADRDPSGVPASGGPADEQEAIETGRRRYAIAALDKELAIVAGTPMGARNQQLYDSAILLGTFVEAGVLTRAAVEGGLHAIARGWDNFPLSEQTIANGLKNAAGKPRDLSAVDAESRRWFEAV
ncbi:MAG: bifunctional DNA primase/polymerase [Sphingomonas sp.]|nr:bifunctional DNA primase/polymerase [Sphingomonas sp.]MDX3885582.1 bifunctional DNA primase/polymerase [Sphingomonas sp.]